MSDPGRLRLSSASSHIMLLQDKRALFAKLNLIAASKSADSMPDPGREVSEKALRRAVTKIAETSATSAQKDSTPKPRTAPTATARIEQDSSPQPAAVIHVVNTPATTTKNNTKRYAHLAEVVATQGVSTRQKRKAEPDIIAQTPAITKQAAARKKRPRKNPPFKPVIPQAQRIFLKQNFYFFPNRDTHAARKFRIAKAKEYGATWIQDFDDTVTHVVVDKGMNFSEVLRFLKMDRLPDHVAVVNEDYPAICISNRSLLDPVQDQFRVRGYERNDHGGVGGEMGGSKERRDGVENGLVLKPPAGRVAVGREQQESSAEKGRNGRVLSRRTGR